MAPTVSLKVWGDFALFTRPELKVERLSYPIMPPSAARGVLDAILFKPQMCWHVRRITALRPRFPDGFPTEAAELPYRFVAIRRNEIQDKIAPRTSMHGSRSRRRSSLIMSTLPAEKAFRGNIARSEILWHSTTWRTSSKPHQF